MVLLPETSKGSANYNDFEYFADQNLKSLGRAMGKAATTIWPKQPDRIVARVSRRQAGNVGPEGALLKAQYCKGGSWMHGSEALCYVTCPRLFAVVCVAS